MGKKKRRGGGGGNKKKGSGGRGGTPTGGSSHTPKKHYCGRREVPPPPTMKTDDDDGVPVRDNLIPNNEDEGEKVEELLEEIESGDCAEGVVQLNDDGGDDFIGDVQISTPRTGFEDEKTEKEIDNGSKDSDFEGSSSSCVDSEKVEANVSNGAASASAESASGETVEAVISLPSSSEKENVDAPKNAPTVTQNAAEPEESNDVPLRDVTRGSSPGLLASENTPPINDTIKESAGASSADGSGSANPSTLSAEDEIAEVGTTMHVIGDVSPQSKDLIQTHVNTPISGVKTLASGESYSGDDNIVQATNVVRTYSSQLSLEEVDLDAPKEDETTLPPLVRAFNGTPNGLSPPTHDSLSFDFQDSTESEAFVFLTASLREILGDDAIGISDDVLSWYIRWKPDVKRAAERFRAYKKFRKENPYVFDDKPLLLSQDPKLAFLIQNGMVIAPEELVAKDGSAVVILRAAKCDISAHDCHDQDASRAILYVLQKVIERKTFDTLKGITIILDLAGVARRNIPRRLATLLSKAEGCFPLRIQAIFIVAMPWWFPAGHRKLFSVKMRSRIHSLKDKKALFEVIERDRLLEDDGGIYNFDLQSWISSTVLDEVEQLENSHIMKAT